MKVLATSTLLVLLFAPASALAVGPGSQDVSQLVSKTSRDVTAVIADEVRSRLVMLSNYGVFDWLTAEVRPDDSVILRGQVTRETIKEDAENRVRELESVSGVDNRITVLPISPTDDAIRLATYRSIFDFDGPLFRYALQAVPPIHIIVNNGRVTLKGAVGSKADRQLAGVAARDVNGVLEITNDLRVD